VDFFIPEDKERSADNIKRSMQKLKPRDGNEYTMLKKDGSTFQVLIFSDPAYKENRMSGLRGIIVDISERKKAENKINNLLLEKDLILKEVHHRIKNNMATIKSLLDLQAVTLKDPAAVAALRDAESRIKSMMVLYDKLYKSVGFGEMPVKDYLSVLIDSIIEEFPGAGTVKVNKDIEEFILDVKKIQPLGIIINELITNIMKYAFNGRGNREIYFSACTEQDRIRIRLRDNGIGIPESVNFENSTGFGLMLIGILIQQLEGSISINRSGGSEFLIEFSSR
ncbi:MAG: histidine kinase dimerization/phosphoacceptor domain -containing protein, partial [Syntrophothermus sp.]